MPIHRPRPALVLILAVAVLAAACSSGGGAVPTEPPVAAESMAPQTAPPSAGESTAPESAPATPSAPAAPPAVNPAAEALSGRAWATAELTDVATGEPFTIADYAGKTIFVESMAIWCSNCRAQQGRFKEALARLDPATVAYVVLTVDPGESGEDLARYKESQGFTGTYAVAGADVSRALVDDFGSNAINPPRVPLIRVAPDGEVTFATGGESVDEIVKLAGG